MKLAWLFLAEGFGRDAKLAVTAIGVNQNLQVSQELPVVTKRGVLAHVTDEEGLLKENDAISLSVEVRNPSGRVISAQISEAIVAPLAWPDLPVAVDVVAEMMLRLHEYGRHSVAVKLTHVDADGQTKAVDGEVFFYLREPPATSMPGVS